MEKTTKKSRKKSKRLKKRIGIIAVGGLSFVLTICLSVGATLAWFAGSTWASKDVYMGGPVYVEMTGSGEDTDDGSDWMAGSGMLDIKAETARTKGTVQDDESDVDYNEILLPGQKIQIQSKARVYSTSETDSRDANRFDNQSSGANTTNTSNNGAQYDNNKGKVTTTTSSVLRARFSINIEFDPSVGFNNFTSGEYRDNYPVQSGNFFGMHSAWADTNSDNKDDTGLSWQSALSTSDEVNAGTNASGNVVFSSKTTNGVVTVQGRRDGVPTLTGKTTPDAAGTGTVNIPWTAVQTTEVDSASEYAAQMEKTKFEKDTELEKIQNGLMQSIYKWRYCSRAEYLNTDLTADAGASVTTKASVKYVKMGYPFNGMDTSSNANGYYGVWVVDLTPPAEGTDYTINYQESDAFYKARTNAYLQSYVEHYQNEYGNQVTRTIQDSLTSLDNSLNSYFKTLINDSSDEIIARSLPEDFTPTYDPDTGAMTNANSNDAVKDGKFATWLYIDPSIGNDTNTNEISTSTGGWWYLVESDYNTIKAGNKITKIEETIDKTNQTYSFTETKSALQRQTKTNGGIDGVVSSTDNARLDAKLFEIKPSREVDNLGTNGTHQVKKVASDLYPFVNGTFALPGDALTNVFANAKISFQISFQAIQAFFPFTQSIDGVSYENALFGSEKALSIRNAIPIYNEAFDYAEQDSTNSDIAL